ncbi:glycosyltransferase family 2 protein [Rubrolithibacter danxiaensis]|uniref:glycosyltransferase family 2 protein n=1 Tax=Rubrolithibacter danxiaensis TaxID=3390805 RepID=UPI003BF928EF
MKVENLSIIILTFNEESNIRDCLQSLNGLNVPVLIVDSGSTDRTLTIAQEYTSAIFTHPFENYGAQRNWAINNLPIQTEWMLQMDADHRLSEELKNEIATLFTKGIPEDINGFLISRRTIFMGKWMKYGGHYPTYHATLFKKGYGHCEEKLYDQHFVVEGKTVKLEGDMIDVLTDSLSSFTSRHNRWSTLEAEDQFYRYSQNKKGLIKGKIGGDAIEQRRFIKSVYERFPLFVRPFIYFFIRYFLKLGFLDGMRGLIFHFLQGFWFRFLIDAKIYELKKAKIPFHSAQVDRKDEDIKE